MIQKLGEWDAMMDTLTAVRNSKLAVIGIKRLQGELDAERPTASG